MPSVAQPHHGAAARTAPSVSTPVPDDIDPIAEALRGHYEVARNAPLWTGSPEAVSRARALADTLASSSTHGLSPARYGAIDLRVRLDALSDADVTLERDLSAAFLRYAGDLISGMIDPEVLDARVHVDPERVDSYELLQRAARAQDLTQFLAGLAPDLPRYRALRQKIIEMMERASHGGWGRRVDAQIVVPGDVSPAVTSLRRRLMATGDLAPEAQVAAVGEASAYDERLREAVARFQGRHGLESDGIAGPATLRALNQPIERRLAQAMLNLERLRWRAKRLSGPRIEVNQAAFGMAVFDEEERPVHEARVIIGQSERRLQTPEFSDYLSYLVLNPTWTVPKSIIWREILPELQKDPGYLAKNNMILLRGGEPVDPETVDWNTLDRETVAPYAVVQRPGLGNALGNVKFMFPNGFNVYLHDTPGKDLFDEDRRNFSHGCVRLERPFALAWYLLSKQEDAPGAFIEDILATEKETSVPLDAPLPIHLLYFTAWVDNDGVLQFRDDVYERDAALAAALHAAVTDPEAPGL